MWTSSLATAGLLAFSGALVTGCADATNSDAETAANTPADERDDSFLGGQGGKADGRYDIEPRSLKAKALLDFVNEADLKTLDGEVGLNDKVAQNIVDARADRPFETLEQLDDVPWFGLHAFQKLYDYADKNGIFKEALADLVHGFEPGSPVAKGILEVANTVSISVLEEDVGLASRTARNIVVERSEGNIESLEALDEIGKVGAEAFERLAAYARDNGYVVEREQQEGCSSHASCGSGQHCIVGSCVEMATWDRNIPSANARTKSDTVVRGSTVEVGIQRYVGGQREDRGHRIWRSSLTVGEAHGADFREDFTSDSSPRVTETPVFAENRSGEPILGYPTSHGLTFEKEISHTRNGLYLGDIYHFDATRTTTAEGEPGELFIAVAQHGESVGEAESGTWVWEESNRQMYHLYDSVADDVEIVETGGGEADVLFLNGTGLYRASRGLDAWQHERVARLPHNDENDSVRHDWEFEAVGHDDHLHVVTYTKMKDPHRLGSDSYDVEVEHFRIRGNQIEQRQTIGTGHWDLDEARYESGSGVRDIAHDIAIDAAGNAYALQIHVTEEGHRQTELVRVAPDGTVTKSRVSNWASRYHDRDKYTYSVDVGDAGDIAVLGYEPSEQESLKVRTFRTVED